MSRTRTIFTVVLPSMLAGGLIFGSAFTRADAGTGLAFWPAAGDVAGTLLAQAPTPPTKPATPPTPPTPPAAPAPHTAPTPPTPPTPPKAPKAPKGIKIDVSGVDEMVAEQIENAKKQIDNAPLPDDIKAKLRAKLDKTKAIVQKRMKNAKSMSPDELGEEMGQMGEEIGKQMEEFGEEMGKWGEQMGKSMGKMGKNFHVHVDTDDDDDDHDVDSTPMAPDVDVDTDDDDLKQAIKDLGDLALNPKQRDEITKIRKDSDKTVADAKKQLDALSGKLHDALGNPNVTDADVGKYVDQITAQEAAIRKARLLAWVHARASLDAAQRKKVEDAAKKKTK